MKSIITAILSILIFTSCFGQEQDTCGTWAIDTIIRTDWETVERIYKDSTFQEVDNDSWAYSRPERVKNKKVIFNSDYPCGFKNDKIVHYYRVNDQGVKQRRTATVKYRYEPYSYPYGEKIKYHEEKQKEKEEKEKDKEVKPK